MLIKTPTTLFAKVKCHRKHLMKICEIKRTKITLGCCNNSLISFIYVIFLRISIFLAHNYFVTFVDLTCFRDESNCRSSCSSSLVFSGPKSSPRRFLQLQDKCNGHNNEILLIQLVNYLWKIWEILYGGWLATINFSHTLTHKKWIKKKLKI